jgi:hypothetical protein
LTFSLLLLFLQHLLIKAKGDSMESGQTGKICPDLPAEPLILGEHRESIEAIFKPYSIETLPTKLRSVCADAQEICNSLTIYFSSALIKSKTFDQEGDLRGWYIGVFNLCLNLMGVIDYQTKDFRNGKGTIEKDSNLIDLDRAEKSLSKVLRWYESNNSWIHSPEVTTSIHNVKTDLLSAIEKYRNQRIFFGKLTKNWPRILKNFGDRQFCAEVLAQLILEISQLQDDVSDSDNGNVVVTELRSRYKISGARIDSAERRIREDQTSASLRGKKIEKQNLIDSSETNAETVDSPLPAGKTEAIV